MVHGRTVGFMLLLLALSACTTENVPPPQGSAALSLTEQLDFSRARLIERSLPDPTDEDVFLLPLGPTVVIEPGDTGLMALQVEDPKDRDIDATLMQFGQVEKHLRVPAMEVQGSDILENNFKVAKALCAGLCDVVFTVVVTEEVEFKDGKISKPSTRQVVVDCRKDGDPGVCGDQDKTGAKGGALLCGDVSKGELLLSGDVVMDAHFDAVRELGTALASVDMLVGDVVSSMAKTLALGLGSDAVEVASRLGARSDAATSAGLVLLLGDPGCALRLARVAHVLKVCDPEDAASLASMQCIGVCEPKTGSADCAKAPSGGCRGAVNDETCAGTCLGACEHKLEVAAACVGTCVGTCDAACPDDGSGGCAGPCSGLCTGTCSATSSAVCDGSCRGICTESSSALTECIAPLVGYCDSESGPAFVCPGDCFGTATLDRGSALCQVNALSLGRIFPRCDAPIVQLSFSYKEGLSAQAKDDFAALVAMLNGSFGTLYAMLARINMLIAANADLSASAVGPLSVRLNKALMLAPNDAGLLCAKNALPVLVQLSAQAAALQVLQADVMTVISTLTPMP